MNLASWFSIQDALFDFASCKLWTNKSASLFLNVLTSLISPELILPLLHSNNPSSDTPVQLPLFQSGYFPDTSSFQIALDHQLFVQHISLYTFLSIGKLDLNFPSSFTEMSPLILFNDFSFGNCVFIGRGKGFLLHLQSIVCTIQAWYSSMLHNCVKIYTMSIGTHFLFV